MKQVNQVVILESSRQVKSGETRDSNELSNNDTGWGAILWESVIISGYTISNFLVTL
jgi:hypothetical protein